MDRKSYIMSNGQGNKAFSMIADIDGDFAKLTDVDTPSELPILPVRNLVLFPGVVSPILIGREKSMRLVRKAEKTGALIGIVCQNDPDVEEPGLEDLFRYGVFAKVVKQLTLPNGALTAIVLIRWGTWAGIHAFLGGLVLCIFSGAGLPQYVIYCVGNLFSLLSVLTFKAFGGKQGITSSSLKTLLFGLEVLLLMQTGRALISLLFGNSLLTAAGFLTTEAVTDLFTLVILWIVRRLDGLLEDQYHYLLRLQEEERSNT